MTKYKVKNIINKSSEGLQSNIEQWIESRKHIVLSSVNIWNQKDMAYGTIIYIENEYSL